MSDTISRQAAIEDIRTMNPKDAQLDIKWVEMWLKQLPPAQPEQRTGKWIIDDDTEKFMMHCSECGKFQDSRYDRRFLFCPHCGAKMEGGRNES